MGAGVKVLVVSDYTAGDSSWLDGLAGQLSGDLPRCRHLTHRPGVGFVRAAEGYGRCQDCHMECVASETLQSLLGGFSGAECGRCEAAVDPGLLRPVAAELGTWVIVSALCPACAAMLLHEGQRAAAGGGEVSHVRECR
ncbi:hypothetical protein HEP81_06548 [Streptomyces griseofuscus]|uniref:Uncharacterized protein n=1 Tax=Streptomyces griseofuscus TaxID=146922 RepID=A0A7H1Q903_9ACTN|nr:hypothetical protein HEP81_06548 [Streptomyces griseofuscus]